LALKVCFCGVLCNTTKPGLPPQPAAPSHKKRAQLLKKISRDLHAPSTLQSWPRGGKACSCPLHTRHLRRRKQQAQTRTHWAHHRRRQRLQLSQAAHSWQQGSLEEGAAAAKRSLRRGMHWAPATWAARAARRRAGRTVPTSSHLKVMACATAATSRQPRPRRARARRCCRGCGCR